MQLSSSAFLNGSDIPRRYTCHGEDLSSPLQWSDGPVGARSFVLLYDDSDAPAGTWHNWGADDISVDRTVLAVDAAKHAEKQGFKQAINDFRRPGYCGPCPRGHVPHHCHFRLLAISFDHFSMRKA